MYEARRALVLAGRRLLETGLTVGTWGNLSCRAGEHMLITPSGMDYAALRPAEIVLVNLSSLEWTGQLKPSTETPLHAAIYRARPEVNAVVHTHAVFSSALAAARRDLPPVLDDLVQIIGGGVRVVPYALPGTNELVSHALGGLEGRMAVLLANHGAVCLGRSLEEALMVAQVLEKAARVFLLAQALGGAVPLADEDIVFMREFFLHRYGQRQDEVSSGSGAQKDSLRPSEKHMEGETTGGGAA